MRLSNFIKKQNGTSAVEFAIVLPLFIVLTFGIIEFGVIMYDKAVITNASREGARYWALFDVEDATEADIKARVTSHLTNTKLYSLGGNAVYNTTVTPDPSTTTIATGDFLSVTVTYPYDFLLVPGFVPVLPDILTLTATTTMRKE